MTYKRPKNETEQHFLLKEISKYILWGWGYNRLGTEVADMHSNDLHIDGKDYKSIIDTVGVKKITNKKVGSKRIVHYDVKGIEAKASLSDFKNGFLLPTIHILYPQLMLFQLILYLIKLDLLK